MKRAITQYKFEIFTKIKRAKKDYVRKLLVISNILKFICARKDKLKEMVGTTSLCRRNRKSLPKRKQLWFDYVEKCRGFHENEGKSASIKTISALEDFRSIIHKHKMQKHNQNICIT
ncbi:hypothetical protein CR513_28708, partial [Mucuna pruriens]